MFKRISASILVSVLICSAFVGCGSKESTVSEIEVTAESDIASLDAVPEEDIETKSESIRGVNYSLTGKIYTSAIFEGGPHDYSFDDFSVRIDASYNSDIDFTDTASIAAFAESYSKEKEVNNFVVSDLRSEQVNVDTLGRSGAVISFNITNDTGMTVYYKMLVFGVDEDFIITSEFSSFYDDREEVVDAEFDKFMLTLSE